MAKRRTYQNVLGLSDDVLSEEFRWPRPGDKAFRTNDDYQANAPLEKHGHARLVLMADGYKMGADAMVAEALGDTYKSATLVFPILFNYRHFIELSIKYTLATYGRAVGIKPIWNTHDLIPLWNRLLEVFDAYGTEDPDDGDPIVGEIVGEFAKLDPDSFAHRYPVDTKGKLIELTMEEIDLETLRDVMGAVDNFFTGVDGYLDYLRDAGSEDN